MSKTISAALAASALLVLPFDACASSSGAADVEHTIRAWNGDFKAPADCKSDGAVIDEFAPFAWASFASWNDALARYNDANAVTESKVDHLKFRHVNVDGSRAYAVVSVVYSYKQAGHPRAEPGMEAISLEKSGSSWCMKSLAWLSKSGVDSGTDATAIGSAVASFASMKPGDGPSPTAITDEFSPYAWQGASAAADWYAGLQKSSEADHDTNLVIGVSDPSHLSVNGDKAYAVYPTVLTFSHNGKPMKERGTFAFALDKTSGAWHITSWAWATQ